MSEQQILRDILVWLWDTHRVWLQNMNGNLANLHGMVLPHCTLISEAELQKELPEEAPQKVDFLKRKRFLHLKPLSKGEGIVPVLAIKYDLTPEVPQLQLGLALFTRDSQGNVVAIGYRFETPEGDGKHNYYHVQPTIVLNRDGGAPLPGCPQWVPTSHPTFTIEAQNVLTLVMCLLVSVYGGEFVKELGGASFWPELRRYVKDMLCVNSNAGPKARYWTDVAGRWRYSL